MAQEFGERHTRVILFQLFRVKAFASPQVSLFDAALTPSDAVRRVIAERPTSRARGLHEWHVGNVTEVKSGGVYFAIGRTTRATIPMFDEEKGEFLETEFESAPYTHAVLDVELEVCGIAKNPQLAPTSSGIARRFQALLNHSSLAMQGLYSFEVAAINDPEEFIEQLRHAMAVRRFAFTFKRLNPIDAYKDVFQPLGKTLAEVKGEEGKVTLKGPDLHAAELEEIARSAASTGDDASADLVFQPDERAVRKRLRGNEASFSSDEPHDDETRRGVLELIRTVYDRIRKH